MFDLSIVILSWNTCDILQQCLESVDAAIGELNCEVLVVDNASSDGSAEMVEKNFPDVRLIRNANNLGFAGGNNQGIALANARYVMLLNPDTIVHPDALQTLIAFADENPQAGAIGPRTLNSDGSLQVSCYPEPTLVRELWRMFHLDIISPLSRYPLDEWDAEKARQVEALQGSCLMVRREVLEQVGLLDEDFFMYTEEVDWCTRMRSQGWLLYWVPMAEIVHLGGQSTKQVAKDMFLELYRSKVQYFRKHRGMVNAILYKGILLAATVARLLIAPLSLLLPNGRRSENRALAINYAQLALNLAKL